MYKSQRGGCVYYALWPNCMNATSAPGFSFGRGLFNTGERCRCECGAANCTGLLGTVAKGAQVHEMFADSDDDDMATGLFDVDEDGTLIKVTQLPELMQACFCTTMHARAIWMRHAVSTGSAMHAPA